MKISCQHTLTEASKNLFQKHQLASKYSAQQMMANQTYHGGQWLLSNEFLRDVEVERDCLSDDEYKTPLSAGHSL